LDVQCLGGPHGATTSNEIEFAAADVPPGGPSGHRGTQLPVFIGLILRFMVLSRFLRAHYGYDGHGHHFETNELLFVSLMMSASGCVSLTLGQQVEGLGGTWAPNVNPIIHQTLEVTLHVHQFQYN